MEKTKECSRCGEILPLRQFDGGCGEKKSSRSYCKDCHRKQRNEINDRRFAEDPMLFRCKRMLSRAKTRAKKRGMDFNLTLEDIVELSNQKLCPICKKPLVWKLAAKDQWEVNDFSPSLDRIDSHRGYTKDNVWIISYRMNAIKNDATPQELAMISQAVNNEIMDRICNDF